MVSYGVVRGFQCAIAVLFSVAAVIANWLRWAHFGAGALKGFPKDVN